MWKGNGRKETERARARAGLGAKNKQQTARDVSDFRKAAVC